ncbi:hypothetical protein QYE76_006074 [Lolium multiflorum]|uniref:SWIM-type domain-containing protein n=1 Tax=Lolium multiflorum TaxID=4521 RepID=A0AAD8W2X7_LOLMU|nr:hypothetical protein QYE76_006074 [Lolium multiflorum]
MAPIRGRSSEHASTSIRPSSFKTLALEEDKGKESGTGSDDEIISWSGPKKPPMTPICCDEPVSFIQPVFRNPKRKTNAAAVERNFNQKIQEQDDMDNSKRKRDTTTSTDDDEDIMCWSGPPKKPRSPIKCTEEIFASNATFRQPRKRQSTSTSTTNTAGSNNVNRDSGQKSSSSSDASEQQRSYGDGQSDSIHQDRRGTQSSHMPPRDPLCHVPKVTPPCPIVPDDRATPAELRTYTHAADLDPDLIPSIGQEFSTFKDAYVFYNTYAKHTGFGIRKGQHNKSRRYLRCVREGTHRQSVNEEDRQRDKMTKRTGCKAFMRLKERSDGTCIVKDITLQHNHTLLLSPSMLVFMRSHKKVDPTLKGLVKDLQFSNIKHVNIMGLLTRLHGGRDKIGCHNRDILNMKAENTRKESMNEVQNMFKFFEDMKKENENFFYDYKVDDENRLENVFWSNASSRAAYADFGDCITFDTTYKSNKHHLPLAVFVGVNNHLQSTIFGVALMGNESEESFKWVFSRFLECMGGKQPICILTDQCPAMAKAIPKIFKRTLHKFCRWHIMNKHKDPLKKLYKLFPDLKDKLTAILNHPLMPSEFEDAWKALIEEYNLHDINVMINLWAERKLWISAYWKEVFCARMTSTQRSESMNFVLKRGFVTERDNLHIFAKQVNNCIQARHEAENAEANASTGSRKTVTRYGFEAQVMDKYTRAVYSVFRERQYHSTAFRIKTSQDNPNIYLVHHYNQSKEFAWSRHEFRVLADEVEGRYECECKLWEHTGLFCHHVIAVFEHLRLDEIPSKYILQRYTKDAVTNPDYNRRDYRTTTDDGTSIEYRRTILYSEAVKIINKGCTSEAKFQIALSAFRDANTNLDNEDAEPENNEDAEMENNEDAEMENNEQSSNQENTTRETGEHNDIPQTEDNDPYADIQPPLLAITKGSKTTDAARRNGKCKPPAPARPEPELDEYGRPKGTRLCGTCNKINGHNSRTCKARQLAKTLLETHKKVYGPTASSANIKVRIRNLLARQHIPENDEEEKLDTDEGECFEDETDDEEYEQEDEDEDITEQEDTQKTPDVESKLQNLNKTGGQRKCSVCNLRLGHYASTCPNREKILQQQIVERQRSDGATMKPKGVKACGTCNKIRGHNSRTCARRQLEEQLLHLQSTENDSNTMEDRSNEKNKEKTQTTPAPIRRSTRKR